MGRREIGCVTMRLPRLARACQRERALGELDDLPCRLRALAAGIKGRVEIHMARGREYQESGAPSPSGGRGWQDVSAPARRTALEHARVKEHLL